MGLHIGVVRFPGSNCDDDALQVVQGVLSERGATGAFLWHKERDLGGVDAIVIPGGFSYGDALRAGCIAAHAPIMAAVSKFSLAGGPVLGICNGFQILCEAGLLEGALVRNVSRRFLCRDVYVRAEGKPTPFTRSIEPGDVLRLPVAHAEGRYQHPEPERLEGEGQVVFRYCDADGERREQANPNGSTAHIAGVCNARGNVVGLMPHPERACEDLLGGTDGLPVFLSAIDTLLAKDAREGER